MFIWNISSIWCEKPSLKFAQAFYLHLVFGIYIKFSLKRRLKFLLTIASLLRNIIKITAGRNVYCMVVWVVIYFRPMPFRRYTLGAWSVAKCSQIIQYKQVSRNVNNQIRGWEWKIQANATYMLTPSSPCPSRPWWWTWHLYSKRWCSWTHIALFLNPEEHNVNNRSHENLKANSLVPTELLQ